MLFFDTALKYLELENYKESLAPTTMRTYYWNLKKIIEFSPEIHCEDIDESFIRNYKIFLQQKGDKPNTVAKALSVFRIFTRKMIADKLIKVDPFENIKIGRVYSKRSFLTIKELKLLYLNYIDNKQFLTEGDVELSC